jgi:quercetin dioxygenase-like cupin family protein
MIRELACTAVVVALVSVPASRSVADEAHAPGTAHTMVTPAEIKWGDAPPVMPPGQKMAVLVGDPSKPGLYIIRGKCPAGYKIPPHWHPSDEHVTVISGTALMGMGDKIDLKTAKTLPAGSFSVVPAKEHHYLVAKTEIVVEVIGNGPFGMTYVNPDDDPSKAATKMATPAKK